MTGRSPVSYLLAYCHLVVVKRDLAGDGFGDKIFKLGPDLRATGARHMVVMPSLAVDGLPRTTSAPARS